ncbi:hypothetical protein D3C76_1626350 [compost metagenome]
MGSAATIAPNAFSKLAFNVMHQDFSNEFNTTLNRFKAKKTDWYLVSGSVSLGPIAPGNAISLSVFVNGNRISDHFLLVVLSVQVQQLRARPAYTYLPAPL